MIAALALRFGVAAWMVELAAVLALAGAGTWYHHHVYHQGELAADARNLLVAKANSDRANAERDRLNGRVAAVQAELNTYTAALEALQRDYEDEKAVSDGRRRALATGAERMQILAAKRPADPNRPPGGAAAGAVDTGGAVDTYDIDPAVAANLEQFRVDHNGAIKAVSACVGQYDALKQAVDALP